MFLKKNKLFRFLEPQAKTIETRVFSGIQKVCAITTPHKKWTQYHQDKTISVKRHVIFSKRDKIFTIGSCFAERIRIALTERGYNVGPDYLSIPIDDTKYKIDSLPQRPHMNYYNTFTIRQEMERCAGQWQQQENDYWEIKDKFWNGETAFQDPYRRLVFGKTPEDLINAVNHVNNIMLHGLKNSSVFFITFGMAEVFQKKDNGLIACQKPTYGGGAGLKETEYHMSSYDENVDNIRSIARIIKNFNKDAKIVLTVSPVPLERSFSQEDVFTANTEGKSILRAAAGICAREIENVYYFPSYEIVTSNGPDGFIRKDGRHVNKDIVNVIVDGFIEAHAKESQS